MSSALLVHRQAENSCLVYGYGSLKVLSVLFYCYNAWQVPNVCCLVRCKIDDTNRFYRLYASRKRDEFEVCCVT